MKNGIFLILCLCTLIGFNSCEKIEGYGPVISETRKKSGFEGLRVSICGQVNFTVAPNYTVEVKAQENILDELETELDRDALVLKWTRPLRIHDCEDVTINISGPDLKFIYTSGSADIDVFGTVIHNDLEVAISGSGSVDLDEVMVRDELKVQVSGSGELYINKGACDNSDLKLSGSGEIDLGKIQTSSNTSHVSGSGKITVYVTKHLQAYISGSGDIYYFGNPRVESKISGSGRVKAL